MSKALVAGSRVSVPAGDLEVTVAWRATIPDLDVDASAFLLAGGGHVPSDEHMVFYNQSLSPCGSVETVKRDGAQSFVVRTGSTPGEIATIAFCLTIHDAARKGADLSSLAAVSIAVAQGGAGIGRFDVPLEGRRETALILGELYRKDGWRFRAVGQGYAGGLAPLAGHFGVVVEADPGPVVQPAPARPEHAKAPVSLTKVDLRKRMVGVVLEKKGVPRLKARVVMIIDRSGSMGLLYDRGVVQDTFERVLPVAARLAANSEMEVWFFADRFVKSEMASEANMDGYVGRNAPSHGPLLKALFGFGKSEGVGIGNNEAPCMRDVMAAFGGDRSLPTLVLFFHDGGVTDNKAIEKALVDAAGLPLFWQFIGLGRSNYGVLERLDDLPGRVVDNCDFFPLDDIQSVTDEELYARMLNEFPGWVAAAKAKGILA